MGKSVDNSLVKRRICEIVGSKEPRLVKLLKKHMNDIHYYNDSFSKTEGDYDPGTGKISINLGLLDVKDIDSCPNLTGPIVTTFHEIGHKIDTKSEYYFKTEWRARRFESAISKRLGSPFTAFSNSSFMTVAAARGDYDTFGQLFNLSSVYSEQVGVPYFNCYKSRKE